MPYFDVNGEIKKVKFSVDKTGYLKFNMEVYAEIIQKSCFSQSENRINCSKKYDMCKILERISTYKIEDLYDLFDEEFANPPINIHQILDKLQVKYNALDFSTLEGTVNDIILPDQADMVMGAVAAYSKSTDGIDAVEITVNTKDSYHRQRFTLAHELAHCMLHSQSLKNGRLELRTSMTTDDPREREANILAGQILIPENLLRRVYKDLVFPFLPELAKIFEVSENVMAERLKYLKMGYYVL